MKMIRIMKVTFALLLCFVLPSVADIHAQQVSITIKNASLADVIWELRQHTGIIFLYSDEDIREVRDITLDESNRNLYEVLEKCLKDTPLEFQETNGTIVIKRSRQPQSIPQEVRKISGTVVDNNGEPLPGATVRIQHTSMGVATNARGEFQLNLPASGPVVLEISFIGMENKIEVVTDQTTLHIVMRADETLIDEVVVSAYGTAQRKSNMVGSAFQVNAKQLETLPLSRIDNLLDGMVPGLYIEPNADYSVARTRYNIRIRGNASLSAGSEPLWIVDGVPIYTGDNTNQISGMSYAVSPLSFINAQDIESITVLKDATETAIYGADGSNGIIIVTTKSGKSDSQGFSAFARYGVVTIDKSTRFKVLNGEQYLSLAREAWENAGKDMAAFPYQDNKLNPYSTTNTDWHDVYYRTGHNLDAGLSINHGTQKLKQYISLAYHRESPITRGNTQERISFRSNSDIRFSDRFRSNLKIAGSYNTNHIFTQSHDHYELLPIFSPYNNDGSFRLWNVTTTENPGATPGSYLTDSVKFFNSVAEREENDNRQRTVKLDLNAALVYEIIKGLELTAQFGVDYMGSYEDIYRARTNWSGMSWSGKETYPKGSSRRAQANSLHWINVERLNFNRSFGKHVVGAVAGFELTNKEYQNLNARGTGFANDMIKEVGYAEEDYGYSSSDNKRAMSYFIKANYGYDQRYFFSASFRGEGHSEFGKNVRWSEFASAGVSWNLHNEDFFNSSLFTRVKLKASFGSTGNSRIGSARSLGVYTYSSSYSYGGKLGAAMTSAPNPGLTWETTYKTNLGLGISLLNRIDIDLEGYFHKTVDMISNLDVSRTIGNTRIYRNVGSMRNSGVELVITSHNVRNEVFTWTTDLNMSHNRNKILKLYNGMEKRFTGGKIWQEGKDADVWYLIRWAGVDPRDGNPLWYDKEGNITRTYNEDNRVAHKTSRPTVSGGMRNELTYKDFTLSVALSYSIGGYALSSLMSRSLSDGYNIINSNQAVEALDRWRKPGDVVPNPRNVHAHSMRSTMYTTRFLFNKSYLRIQNVALGYILPESTCAHIGIKGGRIMLIGDNLGLFTQGMSKNRNSYRTLMNGDPVQRTFSLNLDISF